MCQIAALLALAGTSIAGVIPSPELPYGSDIIRTTDGFQCSSAIAPSSYIDTGIYQENKAKNNHADKGIYVRVMIPLYTGVKRLDCSKLYELALKEREREKSLDNIAKQVFE
jgi:hypothetical protein